MFPLGAWPRLYLLAIFKECAVKPRATNVERKQHQTPTPIPLTDPMAADVDRKSILHVDLGSDLFSDCHSAGDVFHAGMFANCKAIGHL